MRILVVDSDPAICELCARAAAEGGHDLEAAADIARASAVHGERRLDLVIAGPHIAPPSTERAAELDRLVRGRRAILYIFPEGEAGESLPELEWKLMAGFAISPITAAELRIRIELYRREISAERGAEAVLDAIPDLMFRQRRDLTYIDYHAPREKLLAPPEEFMGKTSDQVLAPHLADKVRESIAHVLDHGEPVQFEYEAVIPGTTELQRFEARMVASGPDEVLSIIRDLTALRRAGVALAESQETVRALLAGTPDSVFRIHYDGTFLDYIPKNKLPRGIEISPSLVGSKRPEIEAAVPILGSGLGDAVNNAARLAIDEGEIQSFDYSLGNGDNERNYEVRLVRCGDDQALGIVRDVTENRRAERELRASADAKQAFASRILNLQENERRHIARELHDAVGQMLLVHKLDAEWIRAQAGSDITRDAAEAMCASIDETLKMVRSLASGLRPPALDDLGIGPALESLIEDISRRAGIRCEHNIDELAASLPVEAGTALYRIAQEALANAVRHGGPSKVWLTLRPCEGGVILVVEDNGTGIDPQLVDDSSSLGLLGMTERAELLGGRVRISNRFQGGTSVRVELPDVLHSELPS